MLLAVKYNYASRDLERQIDSLLFERTMVSTETTKQIVARQLERNHHWRRPTCSIATGPHILSAGLLGSTLRLEAT